MATAFDVRQQALDERAAERRFLLSGIPWWTYVALRDAMGDDDGVRMTYLHGDLELMSPSILHEGIKKLIARLVEVWAMEHDVDLRGFGSATFRKEAEQRGLEPDECYKLGAMTKGDVPDLAIEVVVSRPLVDKLAVYAGLGVPEVWLWADGRLTVHCRVGSAYQERARSELLPELDFELLSRFLRPDENQTRLAKEYRDALRR